MPEYKAIDRMLLPELQKLLNQWRHQYKIELHGLRFETRDDHVYATALIERTERVA